MSDEPKSSGPGPLDEDNREPGSEDGLPRVISEMAARGVRVNRPALRSVMKATIDALKDSDDPEDRRRVKALRSSLKSIRNGLDRGEQAGLIDRIVSVWARRPKGRFYDTDPPTQTTTKKRIADGRGVRDAYIPADGHAFVDVDLKNAHTLIAAALSRAPGLFVDIASGGIYPRAAEVFCPEIADPELAKDAAKVCVNASLNQAGKGEHGIHAILGKRGVEVTPEEGKARRARWLALYPELAAHPCLRTQPWQRIEADILVRALEYSDPWSAVLALHDGALYEVPEDDTPEATAALVAAWARAATEVLDLPDMDPDLLVKVRVLPTWGGQVLEAEQAAPGPGGLPHATEGGLPYLVLHGTKSTEWFVKRPGGSEYIAVADKVLRQELQRLYPDLETFYVNEDGDRKPMQASMLFELYGRRANDLVWSYIDESTYRYGEDNGGTLILRCCRLDPLLKPEWSDEVDRWLTIFAGDRKDYLYDWLSCGTRLDRPIAAAYFEGKNGSGKGLLIEGFARMWGPHVAKYADVMGITSPFNAILRFTPTIRLDERAPKSPNGSADFRDSVGNSTRALYEKNKTAASLLGCPRHIIAANNPDALRFGEGEHLIREDEEAIALRVLHFKVDPAAKQHLIDMGGRDYTARWLDDGPAPGALPRHIYWLCQNWKVKHPGSRLLVEGTSADWFRNAHLRGGLASEVLDAIGNYITVPGMKAKCEPQPILFDANYPHQVIVSNQRLRAHWGTLLGKDQRAPSHIKLSEALDRLAPAGRSRPVLSNGDRPWGYVIPLAHLGDRLDP